MSDAPVFFGLEAGGTKCVCLVARGADAILAQAALPTTNPAQTLGAARAFFTEASAWVRPAGCGIASFGPIQLDTEAADFGHIANTPKPGWSGADMRQVFAGFDAPLALETDVNGAALAEWKWGAGRGLRGFAYATIGTGIGAGVLRDGRALRGAWHFELGHLRPRRAQGDDFAGTCPFHGDCLEGLASGPAIQARWGVPLSALADDHPAHAMQAEYLGQFCAALAFAHAPERIVLGGGVMQVPGLLERAACAAYALIGGYASWPAAQDSSGFVQRPLLGDRAGPWGAIALAMHAAG